MPLRPSAQLAAGLAVVHIGAMVLLIPLDLPLWVKLSSATLVLASLLRGLWRHALLMARDALVAIELREHDRASVQTRDGSWLDVKIQGTTYVSPLLSVLNVQSADEWFARHILLVRDNVDAEDFRRLRVQLRWDYRPSPDA